jgi:hypothetical protein
MACSQQGSRKAFTASLLQIAHRSLIGMSSGASELGFVLVSGLGFSNAGSNGEPDELGLGIGVGRSHVVGTTLSPARALHGWWKPLLSNYAARVLVSPERCRVEMGTAGRESEMM